MNVRGKSGSTAFDIANMISKLVDIGIYYLLNFDL